MHDESMDLHEAAFSGDIRRLKKLLEADKEGINKKDEVKCQTPLHKAAMNGWSECSRFLLQKGADVNSQDVTGCTPLHLAAGNGYRDTAQLLVEEGQAKIDQETKKGHTPKYMARTRGHTCVVAFFNELESQVEQNWMN